MKCRLQLPYSSISCSEKPDVHIIHTLFLETSFTGPLVTLYPRGLAMYTVHGRECLAISSSLLRVCLYGACVTNVKFVSYRKMFLQLGPRALNKDGDKTKQQERIKCAV